MYSTHTHTSVLLVSTNFQGPLCSSSPLWRAKLPTNWTRRILNHLPGDSGTMAIDVAISMGTEGMTVPYQNLSNADAKGMGTSHDLMAPLYPSMVFSACPLYLSISVRHISAHAIQGWSGAPFLFRTVLCGNFCRISACADMRCKGLFAQMNI